MDAAKLIPVMIVVGSVSWFAKDKYERQQIQDVGILSASVEDCEKVREHVNHIGGQAPTPAQRVEQACRLHVCDMSFMHGRILSFPAGQPLLESSSDRRTLKGTFSATDSAGKQEYNFSCSVTAADLERPGLIPVVSPIISPVAN